MFNNNVEPLENLIDQFAQFPGIGRKSAVRMAYQVMSMPPKPQERHRLMFRRCILIYSVYLHIKYMDLKV